MTFVHPLLVWGTLLGSIPIIIHLLSRRRYRVVRWAATDFLLAALAERSRSVRIQDLILLMLRVLVLVLAAGAVARPILTADTAGWVGLDAGSADVVIVLDNSYSMRCNVAGETRMASARAKAHAVLASLPKRTRVGVVYMNELATPATDGLIDDRVRIGAAIDGAIASSRGTDVRQAMTAALEMLQGSTASTKRVLIVTDLQARAFDRGVETLRQTLAETDRSVGFVVLPVADARAANLAVSGLELKSRWLRAGVPIRFEAWVKDVGEPVSSAVGVELWVDGRKVDRKRVEFADRRAIVTFEHTFTATGLWPVEVRLDADAIDIDNQRHLAVSIPSSIEVAVVTGDRSESEEKGKPAFVYIETALSVLEDQEGVVPAAPFHVRPRVAPDRLAEVLADDPPAVVILADSGALPINAVEALTAWAQQGGSVLVSVGADAVATLGPLRTGQSGAGTWFADVAFTPPDTSDSAAEHPLQLDVASSVSGDLVVDLDSPGVRDTLSAVNVFRALTVETQEEGDWSVFLKYTDGRAALMTKKLSGHDQAINGTGRLALLTSSLDATWSDLPYRPAMVPLLHDTLLWLAWPRLAAAELRPGDVWRTAVKGKAAGLKVLMPENQTLEAAGFLEPIGATDGATLRFDRTADPGVYRLAGGAEDHRDALHAVAVNVDTGESDQDVWSVDDLLSLFPRDRCKVLDPEMPVDSMLLSGLSGNEVWPVVALCVLGFLVLEMVLAHRFGLSRKTSDAPASSSRRMSQAGGGL